MKKQIMRTASSNIRKAILHITLFAVFFFLILPAVPAQEDKPLDPSVAIRYVGSLNEQPVFQIDFENTEAETYYISIRDDEGNVLYNEKVKDAKYSKKFKIEHGSEYARLTFTLSNDRQRKVQVYQINTNTRMIQDVVVTRL